MVSDAVAPPRRRTAALPLLVAAAILGGAAWAFWPRAYSIGLVNE